MSVEQSDARVGFWEISGLRVDQPAASFKHTSL
jgi:hypothetical protein